MYHSRLFLLCIGYAAAGFSLKLFHSMWGVITTTTDPQGALAAWGFRFIHDCPLLHSPYQIEHFVRFSALGPSD